MDCTMCNHYPGLHCAAGCGLAEAGYHALLSPQFDPASWSCHGLNLLQLLMVGTEFALVPLLPLQLVVLGPQQFVRSEEAATVR